MHILTAQSIKKLLIASAQRGITARHVGDGQYLVAGQRLSTEQLTTLVEAAPVREFTPAPAQPRRKATGSGTCARCSGEGWITGYGHVEGGICFACRGSGRASARRSA